MTEPSTTSYAILGLLALRPWTTYELAKQVQRSLRWFWPRAERKLYDEPKQLVADGLATARAEATGKRPRTVYDITDEGRAELVRWLAGEPAERTLEFEGMVRVFFSDGGSLDQLRTTLHRIEADAEQRIEALAAMAGEPSTFPERLHIAALCLRFSLDQEQAVLAWARWALAQVEQWQGTTDPGDWDV